MDHKNCNKIINNLSLLFEEIKNDKVPLNKAKVLVQTSQAIITAERTKIQISKLSK